MVTTSPTCSLYNMVVFPAPSKPKIKILISLVPNRPEKRLEKKPPGGMKRGWMTYVRERIWIHHLYYKFNTLTTTSLIVFPFLILKKAALTDHTSLLTVSHSWFSFQICVFSCSYIAVCTLQHTSITQPLQYWCHWYPYLTL